MSVSITPENEIKRIRIKASYFFNNTLLYGNMLCEYIQRTKLEDFVKEQLIEWVRTYLISIRSNDFFEQIDNLIFTLTEDPRACACAR